MKKRLLAMLMALAMVLAYMPAMAFAEDEEPAALDKHKAIAEEAAEEVTETPAEVDAEELDVSAAGVESFTFTPASSIKECYGYTSAEPYAETGDKVTIDGTTYTYDEDEGWMSGETALADYYIELYADVDTNYLNDRATFTYTVYLNDNDTDEVVKTAGGFNARLNLYYKSVWINGLRYELNNDENPSAGAGVWDSLESLSGHVDVLSSVTLSDGVTYTVNCAYINGSWSTGVTSVSIPTSVTDLWCGLSSWDEDSWDSTAQKYNTYTVIPGFTIFGTTGSYAQTYANKYGITFRDLAAEAEAARQGTYLSSLPKVTAAKPAAAKKAVTVKWKKLSKKAAKKAGKVEIWVCPNKAFGASDTVMKTAKKTKSSLKVKGLKKKTTYFVKVRSIKYVNGVKYVGKWSKVKKIKTK